MKSTVCVCVCVCVCVRARVRACERECACFCECVCTYQYYYWVILFSQKGNIINTGSVCVKYGGYDLNVTNLFQVCNC